MFPSCRNLELFGRRWNCRSNWTRVGKEVLETGTLEGCSFDSGSVNGKVFQFEEKESTWKEIQSLLDPYAENSLYFKTLVTSQNTENMRDGKHKKAQKSNAAWVNDGTQISGGEIK
eukprot:snap_masked-scaffold_70-processed-gene-0.28-mRNA-1 protein AED:0.58 eAED:0.58 QI:0/-1/0/1/-1/1/1/0/115